MKKIALALLAAAVLCGCARDIKTIPGGFIAKTENGTSVRLTALGEGIVRVSAVPSGCSFPRDNSLIVTGGDRKTAHSVETCGGAAILKTAAVEASLDLVSGRVTFRDSEGKVISSEDRREFTPIEVEGTGGWTVRQVFEAQDGEGFYGLGQHQADEWDYKGRNEELYQYNTKISVPFVVSSRRYGILWDSYSLCRWGDPREYSQLGEVFTLYDSDGVEGGLTGRYTPREGDVLVRTETALAQEFLRTPECDVVVNSPEGFKFEGASVVYDGFLEPHESGIFHFYMYYAGYTNVWLGGEKVMPEIWRTAWNPNGRKFERELEAGVKVPLHIEWKPDGGVSYCGLRVLSPVPQEEQAKMSWWGEMQDQIDYYFIKGDDIDGVISGYRTLTGKSPVVPKWAMGYWQSRERYTTQDEVVSTLREFRDRHIPIDNIVQDWQYWLPDQWGSHEFDASRYPDPKAMVDSVHALGGRFMISVWPKFYTGTEHFRELDERGWMYRTAVRDSVEDWLGFQQSFYDAYAPGARKLFWQQMKDHLYPTGVDSWWMDASEPNIHDCTDMDYRKAMCGPTALGPSTKYFNAYALMNAQAIYEGQRSTDNRRVFLLTRNGFAGLQRYSTASWSGDIGTRWEDMKAQISAGLNYSISGIPMWGQDIGGFSVEGRYFAAQQLFDATGEITPDLEEWRELQLRWHQWGVYCPLYRSHGQWPLREPWNIAPAGTVTYDCIVKTDHTRYELMPYIYTLASRVHFEDYTIMRPLVMDFTDDPVARAASDEFLFGDAILVCPVYEYGAREREVYLPAGCGWYDNFDNRYYEGGTHMTAPAPIERIPVYCREGQIVVSGPCVESTADAGDGSLNIFVYSGRDASFTLYEDDGTTYAYEDGAFSRIPLAWNEEAQCLTVGAREGSYDGMIASRPVNLIVVRKDGLHSFIPGNQYDGHEITIKTR